MMAAVASHFSKIICRDFYLKNAWHFSLCSTHSPKIVDVKVVILHQFYSNKNVKFTKINV